MVTYDLREVVSFLKTERFGGLSNMAAKKYPLFVNGYRIDNSEALYQACRFPGFPEIQEEIDGLQDES